MFLIKEKINAQIEVKKSKFIAFLIAFDDFEFFKNTLKNEHPKAAHIVWAYRFLNEFDQIVENSSDDGEPKGSSAPAVLNALRGSQIINTACLVVRYFGGIKLGVGGLVRAYGSAANEAIKSAKELEILEFYEKKEEFKFFASFALIARIEHFVKAENLNFKQDFSANGCDFAFWLNKNEKQKLNNFLKELGIF